MHLLAAMLAISAISTDALPPRTALPPVAEVQHQALAHARIDLDGVIDWRRRARRAAYVPRVQLDFGNRLRDYVNVNVNDNVYVGASGVVVGPQEGTSTQQQTADCSFGVRAVWELGEAVFSRAEVAASAEARSVLKERNALLEEVSRRYLLVERMPQEVALLQRLATVNPRPDKVQHEIFLREVACEESAAMLDGLTGGWFLRAVGGARLCEPAPEKGRRG